MVFSGIKLKMSSFAKAALVPALMLILAVLTSAQSGRVQQTPTPPREDETIRLHTEEIKLNVLAFDEKGSFFRDVTADDVVITEDNILHQPTSVRRLPANVLIVMDTGGEMRSVKSLDKTRSVAAGIINSLRPDDSVAILEYSDKAEIVSDWTNDKTKMQAVLKKTTFGRKSVFVDALNLATDFLTKSGRENKHLVLITDGTDSLGRSSAKFEAMQRLLTTDVSVHVISYTALEGADIEPETKRVSNAPHPNAPIPVAVPEEVQKQMPNGVYDPGRAKVGPTVNMDRTMLKKLKARKVDLEVSQQQLARLAEDTNGEFILPESIDEMVEKSALVARMIDSTYVVTYTPKVPVVETRGVATRNIDITSKRPGLVVQARRKLLLASSRK